MTPDPAGGHQSTGGYQSAPARLARSHGLASPDGGVVEPDLLVMNRAGLRPPWASGAPPPRRPPLLVVEILSPSNPPYDLAVKRALYKRDGAPAYWIVDRDRPSVLALGSGRWLVRRRGGSRRRGRVHDRLAFPGALRAYRPPEVDHVTALDTGFFDGLPVGALAYEEPD